MSDTRRWALATAGATLLVALSGCGAANDPRRSAPESHPYVVGGDPVSTPTSAEQAAEAVSTGVPTVEATQPPQKTPDIAPSVDPVVKGD
jgi:hypothetical protein